MDTSDPLITFDGNGNCNHCNTALSMAPKVYFPDEEGEKRLQIIAEKIKKEEKGKDFDCVIGLSGGVDSSYLAYLTVRLGMRPLVVHIDCGWNSELAVKNIENVVKALKLELHTLVVNWEEMKDLQRAFFKASLPDQDIPQDHAIFAGLYNFASRNNVRYAFNGVNFSTEAILPSNWGYQAMDLRHLRAVHRQFGEKKLKDYPTISFFNRFIYYGLIRGMKIISPLNYINYSKKEAISTLGDELGWQYYGGKHHESRFTKFFQSFYLPVKFNIDKRRAHLSSLIITGQVTREEALAEVKQNVYSSEAEINDDLGYVAKKLDWTPDEFRNIISQSPRNHLDFPNSDFLFTMGIKTKRALRKYLG